MRITLNAILRAVFGAEGAELDELRRILPPWVTLGSRLATLPKPTRTYGRYSPWGRLAEWRRRYDAVIDKLIDDERADPNFEDRTDVLAMMLRSTYEDGSAMSRKDIGDELLTLLAAGHETTASTLGWAFERVSRHPDVLTALVAEADTDDNELRQATILEVQRARTVIDARRSPRLRAGLPTRRVVDSARAHSIIVSISRMHGDPDVVPRSGPFRPAALRRDQAAQLRLDSVRWRYPPLCGSRVRQHGDGRRAANGVAPLHYRDDGCAGGEAALPRCRLHPEGRRKDRGAPALNSARAMPGAPWRRYWSAVARRGSFQPGRMKWQVYPLG